MAVNFPPPSTYIPPKSPQSPPSGAPDLEPKPDGPVVVSDEQGRSSLLTADGQPMPDASVSDQEGESGEDGGKDTEEGTSGGQLDGPNIEPSVQTGKVQQTTQIGDVAGSPVKTLTPINAPLPDFPSGNFGPLNLPQLPPLTSTDGMSTADLMQVIRKEIKQLSEMLQKAQAEVIQSRQTSAAASSKATIEKLNEAIEKLEEAQKIKDAMGIFNKVMYGVMGVMLALFTPMLCIMPPMAAVAWAAYASYIYVNEADNGKPMEDIMKQIGEDWGVAWESEGKDKQRENGMISFTAFMAALQVIIAVISIIASFGGTAPASAGVAATTTATSVALTASQAAAGAASSAAMTAGTTAATTAATATTTAAATAATTAATTASTTATTAATQATSNTLAQVMMWATRIGSIAQSLVSVGAAGAKIGQGVYEYEATMSQADVEEMKAVLKSLQSLLQADQDFLAQLVRIQAQMDQGVAGMLRQEHETSQQIAQMENYS